MKAVHFGAGNIGRGFLGQLYFESGYEVVFVDVDEQVLAELNEKGRYPVRIVDAPERTVWVEGVRAVSALDRDAVAREIAEADICGTSVGARVLPRLGANLAAGLEQRGAKPLNVLICENVNHGARILREATLEALDPALQASALENTGFIETSIGRMVPVMTAEQREENPLLVCVEAFAELPVDGEALVGEVPPIVGLQPKSNFQAYVERKLFVHNCGHAVAAYLGHLCGYAAMWQAMEDPLVESTVARAHAETCRALHLKHGLDEAELLEHAADLRKRFGSRALGDQVARVGGDPMRKLSPDDRLIGALRLCEGQSVEPDAVAEGVAAALLFDVPGDPSAAQLKQRGPEAILIEHSGLEPGSALLALVLSKFEALGAAL